MLFKRGTPGSLRTGNCWHLLFLIEVARTEFFCFRFSFFPALLCHQSLSKHGGSLVLFLKYATYNRAYINIFFHCVWWLESQTGEVLFKIDLIILHELQRNFFLQFPPKAFQALPLKFSVVLAIIAIFQNVPRKHCEKDGHRRLLSPPRKNGLSNYVTQMP